MRAQKKSFTLIEVLVVVSIVSALAVALIGVLNSGLSLTRRAKSVNYHSNMVALELEILASYLRQSVYLEKIAFVGDSQGFEFATIKDDEAKIVIDLKHNTFNLISPINLSVKDLQFRAKTLQLTKKSPKRNPKKKITPAGKKLKSFKARVKYMLYMDTPGNQTLEIEPDGSNDWSMGFTNSRGDYYRVVHSGTGSYGIVLR